MRTKSIQDSAFFEDLQDPEFAAGYLAAVLEDSSLETFLIALRNVSEANGGMGTISNRTRLGRESMYKTLSENGNPQFLTLQSILKVLGLRFSVRPDTQKKIAA